MKRAAAIFFVILIFAGLSACSSGGGEIDISALSQELLDSAAFPDGLEPVDMEAGCYLYGLDEGLVTDSLFYMATGAVADELALIKTDSEESADLVKSAVEARLEYLKDSFQAYNPGEVSQLEGASLKIRGVYVVFVCAEDQGAADAVLKKYF